MVDNRDGTRSLLNRGNKKLLVTFRAENQVREELELVILIILKFCDNPEYTD